MFKSWWTFGARASKLISILPRKILAAVLITAGILALSRVAPTPASSDSVNQSSTQTQVDTQSANTEPIQADARLLQEVSYQSLPVRIVIPGLGIDIPIRSARVIAGRWEVFDDSASFGLGSAPPGTIGNTVVFAHARPGYFLPLRQAKVKQLVYVLGTNQWYAYEIETIKEVTPDDISVIAPTENETLTLYTCSGFADSKRVIVAARRVP